MDRLRTIKFTGTLTIDNNTSYLHNMKIKTLRKKSIADNSVNSARVSDSILHETEELTSTIEESSHYFPPMNTHINSYELSYDDLDLNIYLEPPELAQSCPIIPPKSSTKSNAKSSIVSSTSAPTSTSTAAPISITEEDMKSDGKRKFRRLTAEEDPMSYHARPRDLIADKSAAADIFTKRETSSDTNTTANASVEKSSSARIFSRVQFQALHIDARLAKNLENCVEAGGFGLATSTYVQSAVIPVLLKKKQNLIIKSQTGSGKTLAYLIPIVHSLMQRSPPIQRHEGTRALILAPTRELCAQILQVLSKLVKCCVWIVGGCLSGGEKKKSEKARLRKGISILVSTPGRLLDHLKTTESFSLQMLEWAILDEADRLLDMGFEKTVIEIFEMIRGQTSSSSSSNTSSSNAATNLTKRWSSQRSLDAKRSNHASSLCCILVSATLTKAISIQLAGPIMSSHAKFLLIDADKEKIDTIKNAAELISHDDDQSNSLALLKRRSIDFTQDTSNVISLSSNKKSRVELGKDDIVEAPENLVQYFMMVTCKWRLAALVSFLRLHQQQKVIVFFSTCDAVDFHALLFRDANWPLELDPAPDDEHCAQRNDIDYKRTKRLSTMEPLSMMFQGMFGNTCNIFRLHGNMPQQLRHDVFESFAASSSGVLLCTDVAARGLDLPRVDWILQYDPPCETTDYVHRIGRTARKGHSGSALIFLLPAEASYIHLLQSHSLQPQALSLLSLFTESSKLIPGASKFKNTDEMAAVILQRRLDRIVSSNIHLTGAAQQAFRSFTRAYATHSADTKAIFKVQSLHLGHVAKSFALRENPQAIRVRENDVIGRIMNGEFARANVVVAAPDTALTRAEKRKQRDEKYSLSARKRISTGGAGGWSPGSKSNNNKGDKNHQQKMRRTSSTSSSAAGPSGRFRKSGGYFRKKLRSQSSSEFSQ